MSLSQLRVVLVRTKTASNLGAVARVMRNLGLSDLVLVAPDADPSDPRAALLATRHGLPILESARRVDDLGEAVAECLHVAATSALVGGLIRGQSSVAVEEAAPSLASTLALGPVALVFGPEPTGLTTEEVARCHQLLHIPTDPVAPALNLAQAAAITLYSLRSAWLTHEPPTRPSEPPAAYAVQERMFDHLRIGLEEIHFLYGDKAEALCHALRHLISRAQPTEGDVRLLHGLARQMRWIAQRAGRPPSDHRENLDNPSS